MELIPLITLEKRKIIETNQKTTDTKEINQVNEDEKIYVLDKDGIVKDKPNLCLFQSASGSYGLWVDSGPVDLGDVVDSFMAGATAITIRKNMWNNLDIENIREITENEIFFEIDLRDIDEINNKIHLIEKADGIVLFNEKKLIELDSKYTNFLKQLCNKIKIYAYETNSENIFYWENKGITGLLVNIKKIKEFRTKWQLKLK